MVLVNGVKYACERCIRGHRVTTCNHTDQPLMMIKPKGRPSTTCAHCKELKKNRNSNPSGVCTCGREEKRRLLKKAKEEARAKLKEEKCGCHNKAACTCHKLRQRKSSSKRKQIAVSEIEIGGNSLGIDKVPRTVNNNVEGSLKSGQFAGNSKFSLMGSVLSVHSVQSGDTDPLVLVSPAHSGVSNNFHGSHAGNISWDNNSVASSLQSETYLGGSNTPLGLDPLLNINPVTPLARMHMGEVSISLNEDIPSDPGSNIQSTNTLMNLNDRISLQDDGGKEEKLDFFTDTSKAQLNYNELKQKRLRKPLDVTSQDNGVMETTGLVSSNSMRSASPTEIVSPTASLSTSNSRLRTLNSSDSILSLQTNRGNGYNNAHYYQNMIHYPLNQKSSFSFANSPSVHSVDSVSRQAFPNNNSIAASVVPSAISTSYVARTSSIVPATSGNNQNQGNRVEEMSLNPNFIDLPVNAYKNPYHISNLNNKQASEPQILRDNNQVLLRQQTRQRSVSIHKDHRYDQFSSQEHQFKKTSINTSINSTGINPNELSTLENSKSTKSFASSSTESSANTSANPKPCTHKPSMLESTFTAEFNQLLSETTNALDTECIFSANCALWNSDISVSPTAATIRGTTLPQTNPENTTAITGTSQENANNILRFVDANYADLDSLITNL
ncbi:Cup2p Ecym_6116 [Eremothecium cymbalariae DBVPG|uniref:Copper-fist domain-containing protein n=1 Tax=Eremothecium cymbalariae (strain CBS 270.75 / DBVPG 7215 / KCTC 17166 / NRRL Y-17582) TaxID=931890 RepID=G8JV30_ERECY|nr:hypothetical protein Ecym_6116 [Eremothecium cymbalariae DBVPG\